MTDILLILYILLNHDIAEKDMANWEELSLDTIAGAREKYIYNRLNSLVLDLLVREL